MAMQPTAQTLEPVRVLLEQIEQRLSSYEPAPGRQLLLPEVFMGPLALRLARAAAFYPGREMIYVESLGEVFTQLGRPSLRDAYFDLRYEFAPAYTALGYEGRRLPKPYETIVETMRRLRDARVIERQTSGVQVSAILGGSTSYGRFYNVRGKASPGTRDAMLGNFPFRNVLEGDQPPRNWGKVDDASDLDFLLVVDEMTSLPNLLDALGRVDFINRDDLEAAQRRAELYRGLQRDAPIVFSQKFRLHDRKPDPDVLDVGSSPEYKLSLHVTSRDTFGHIIHEGRFFEDNQSAVIFDYRADPPSRGIRRGFDGYEESFDQEAVQEPGGFVVEQRVFEVTQGRFLPGLFQQMILPAFEARWEHPLLELQLPLTEFKWKVIDRLRAERWRYPSKQQSLSLTHVRYHVFSPHVRRRTDAYEIEYQ